MRRHCVPEVPSLCALDRALTPEEARLSCLFRLGGSALRRMTHAAELHADAIGRLVAYDVDHRCGRCARSYAEEGCSGAVPRAWFHAWRVTCARCGARVAPARAARNAGESPDLFPHLWARALDGERLLGASLRRADATLQGAAAAASPIPPLRLLRLLMIWTGSEGVPVNGEPHREGWTLDAVVPGFDAALARQKIAIPRTTLIQVLLPARTALLAGLALAALDPETTIRAMWAATSGPHRTHFRYVLTDAPGGHRFRGLMTWRS
jgi:hypothetical protein